MPDSERVELLAQMRLIAKEEAEKVCNTMVVEWDDEEDEEDTD